MQWKVDRDTVRMVGEKNLKNQPQNYNFKRDKRLVNKEPADSDQACIKDHEDWRKDEKDNFEIEQSFTRSHQESIESKSEVSQMSNSSNISGVSRL